jgi:hypothetical protein
VRDEVPVCGGLVVEVELLEVLVCGEPCGLDPCRRSGGLAFGDFTGEDRGQILLMDQPASWAWSPSRRNPSLIRGARRARA